MESAESADNKELRIISIKGTAPAIHCVEKGFSKDPQNLRELVERLANGRGIKSVKREELVTQYTFVLKDGERELLVKKLRETPEQEIPGDSIKIALTEYGERLIRMGISCKGPEAGPRRSIERTIKALSKTGIVSERKNHLEEDGKFAGIYMATFNYQPDPVNEDESSKGIEQRLEKQEEKIGSLEAQVRFSTNLILFLLSEDPKLLKKPEVADYLKKEGMPPTELFLKASDYRKRNVFTRELYRVIEEDTGITREQIDSNDKKREITASRRIMMYLLRREFNKDNESVSLQEIGRYVGGKNHATVLQACKKFQKNGKDFPFELTGDIKTDYENAKALYLHLHPKNIN
jgi:hypothetical protein